MSSQLHPRIAAIIPSINPAKPDSTSTPSHMKPMPQPFTFTILGEIEALPGLTLVERVILSQLAKYPRSGNAKLEKMTRLSNRGVESLLRRLRKQGYLKRVSVEGSRHLMVQGVAAAHTKCGEADTTKSHISCGVMAGTAAAAPITAVAVREAPLDDFLWLATKMAETCWRTRGWGFARNHYERCVERVTTEEGLDPEYRANLLADLQHSANYLFTLEHLIPAKPKMPVHEVERLMSMLDRAPRAKLLEFRRRVESGAALLGPVQEVLELAQAGETVPSQPTGQASTQAPSQPVAPDPDSDDPDDTESDDLD